MAKYAAQTTVSPEKSRVQIEKLLKAHGATGFFYASETNKVVLGFRAEDRIVRFTMPLPDHTQYGSAARVEQATRQRWRCLLLAIKAKFEIINSGISTFEREFFSDIVTPDGATVYEHAAPRVAEAYKTGTMPPLLTAKG